MKIACDTNILISAYRFVKGKPDQVLEKVRQGEIELIISPAILLKFQNVLCFCYATKVAENYKVLTDFSQVS